MKCFGPVETNHYFEIIKWITPVVLFFLGLGFNKISEKLKENRRLRKVELYFYELLESLDSLVTQETEIINDCIYRLKDWQKNNVVLNQSSSRVLDRILEINQEDLFKIFALRKRGKKEQKIKDYKQLNGIIDYLSLTFTHIRIANKKEIEQINRHLVDWNSAHLKTTQFHNELISMDNKTNTDSFLDGFISAISNFNEEHKGTQNIELALDKLIIPLKKICQKHSEDLRASKLMTLLEESTLAFREIKQIRESHSEFLLSVTTDLIVNQKTLNELIVLMKKKKDYPI